MVKTDNSVGFDDGLVRQPSFARLADPSSYAPLPDDWMIATADIAGLKQLVAGGNTSTRP